MASDGEMLPSRPFEASVTSVTAPSALQMMPSHMQQSVSFFHDTVRPESCESPARNLRRELSSSSVQELVGEAKQSNSTRATPSEGMGGDLVLLLLREECSGCIVFSSSENQVLRILKPKLAPAK